MQSHIHLLQGSWSRATLTLRLVRIHFSSPSLTSPLVILLPHVFFPPNHNVVPLPSIDSRCSSPAFATAALTLYLLYLMTTHFPPRRRWRP